MIPVGRIAVFLCLVIAVVAKNNSEFQPEDACSTVGGMCMLKTDCQEGMLAKDGEERCPTQKNSGAVCCYGLPKSWKGCRQKGGECMTSPCNPKIVIQADDCPKNAKCCLLL